MNHYIKIKEKKIDIQSGTHGRKLLITQKIRKEKNFTKKPPKSSGSRGYQKSNSF